MKITQDTWVEAPEPGTALFSNVTYLEKSGSRLGQTIRRQRASDRPESVRLRISDDNGLTWVSDEVVASAEYLEDRVIRRQVGLWLDPLVNRVIRFEGEGTLLKDDVHSGLRNRKSFYAVSSDGGRTFGPRLEMIDSRPGFDAEHPFDGVYYGKNTIQHMSPICPAPGKIMLPAQIHPLDAQGRPYNPTGGFTYTHLFFLHGTWSPDRSRLDWTSAGPVTLDVKYSSRGLIEPTAVLLADGRRIVCLCRASNERDFSIPGYKWKTLSSDGGHTWSPPEPLRYSDGGELFSPSSIHRLIRHSSGDLYWIANVCDFNPKGSLPRYPLTIARIDESDVSVIRESLTEIDTRGEDESERLQLSNFALYEDRGTHELVVALPRLFARSADGKDWTAPLTRYAIAV